MSPKTLPASYFRKCTSRLKALKVLLDDESYSDVVREAQEIVELSSKGILRIGLMDPPHRHDVAEELALVKNRFSKKIIAQVSELEIANHWLRREREIAFYGADDFDPVAGYSLDDALRAFRYAELAVAVLGELLERNQ